MAVHGGGRGTPLLLCCLVLLASSLADTARAYCDETGDGVDFAPCVSARCLRAPVVATPPPAATPFFVGSARSPLWLCPPQCFAGEALANALSPCEGPETALGRAQMCPYGAQAAVDLLCVAPVPPSPFASQACSSH